MACVLAGMVFAVDTSAATQTRQLGIIGTAAQFSATKALRPSIRGDYVTFGDSFSNSLTTDRGLRATAYITWTDEQSGTLAQIIAGGADAYLGREAEAVRAYGRVVYVRFAQEFNGTWFPWSGDPGAYVAAWRHIWTVFRNKGVTNVRWVWGPDLLSYKTAAEYVAATTPYWPGGKYVNVLGPSVVEFAYQSSCEVTCRMARIDWLHATYDKPVWLGETKVDLAEAKTWLGSLDTALASRPWITAVAWSDTPSRGEALGEVGTGNMDWELAGYPSLERLLLKALR